MQFRFLKLNFQFSLNRYNGFRQKKAKIYQKLRIKSCLDRLGVFSVECRENKFEKRVFLDKKKEVK